MPDLAARIVGWMRKNPCEKLVKRTAQEVAVSGVAIDVGQIKVDVGKFSNKVKQLVQVGDLSLALDDSQYLLCTTAASMEKCATKTRISKIRVSMICAITQLRLILATLETSTTDELTKKLTEWIGITNDLMAHAIDILMPKSKVEAKHRPEPSQSQPLKLFCAKCGEEKQFAPISSEAGKGNYATCLDCGTSTDYTFETVAPTKTVMSLSKIMKLQGLDETTVDSLLKGQ